MMLRRDLKEALALLTRRTKALGPMKSLLAWAKTGFMHQSGLFPVRTKQQLMKSLSNNGVEARIKTR